VRYSGHSHFYKYYGVTNYPPVAVDDFDSTNYRTPVVVQVLRNDNDPNGNAITVTAIPCSPNVGTAVNNGTNITYTPGPGANALHPIPSVTRFVMLGSRLYVIRRRLLFTSGISVQAINDTESPVVIIRLPLPNSINDFDPEKDNFGATKVITSGTVGSVTLNADGTIRYVPKPDTCGFVDKFMYVIQMFWGKRHSYGVCHC